MHKLDLSHSRFALIDEQDAERVEAIPYWFAKPQKKNRDQMYACTFVRKPDGKASILYLHRFIMNAPKGILVDHINRDTLDCRRGNLRFATKAQNIANTGTRALGKYGYIGVSRNSPNGLWFAKVGYSRGRKRVGGFLTAEDAAREYDRLAKERYGAFARLNFPDQEDASHAGAGADA